MKRRRRLYHSVAVLATSLAAFGPSVLASGAKDAKKLRPSVERGRQSSSQAAVASGAEPPSGRSSSSAPKLAAALNPPTLASLPSSPRKLPLESAITAPLGSLAAPLVTSQPPRGTPQQVKYPWKRGIVTTTFWVGEAAGQNNPVANVASSWDQNWASNYGGLDTPDRKQRANFLPVAFVPQQNPFYIALPYNDINSKGHKPEAAAAIPWFEEAFTKPGRTVLKGRWLAVHHKGRVAYAQWEDCGPFRTDHAAYVFGEERPKPNLNKGAGLDVSPAVRDYLGMQDTDVTDWRFVDFEEVPTGPWATHGANNTFVQRKQEAEAPVVLLNTISPTSVR
jgi:hypothetical protein